MTNIVTLLFGSDPDKPDGLFPPEDVHVGGHAAQAGDWCQTSPDHAALQWLVVTSGARRKLPRPGRTPRR